MRALEDPVRREMALARYREGYNHADVAKALGLSTAIVRNELKQDLTYAEEVRQAMSDKFNPVLKHAITLALKADEEGDNYGSQAALKLVMQFYSKELDRSHMSDENSKKYAALAQQPGSVTIPVLSTPEAVAAYMQQLPSRDENVLDLPSEEV